GATPPRPARPWQATHAFCSNTTAPSLAVPRPGRSSSPSALIEISMRRSSSAVGVRPTPYVGDCADAGLPKNPALVSSTIVGSRSVTSLGEPVGHLPVLGDLPGHDAVVEPGHSVIPLHRYLPPLGDLLAQCLHLPDLVGGARKNLGLLSIPSPREAEPDVRHALWSRLELGEVPPLSA